MGSQIGANIRARESILGHNLHTEEHERNLMSFPSILHFGPSLHSPAFSGPAAVWQGPSGQHHNVGMTSAEVREVYPQRHGPANDLCVCVCMNSFSEFWL